MKKYIFTLQFFLATLSLWAQQPTAAQKKPLDHSVYDTWKSVGTFSISDNGTFAFI